MKPVKIVKSFEDPEFLEKLNRSNIRHWFWGLSDSGDIYYRYDEDWYELITSEVFAMKVISLKYMKRFVKEFGHLLVFLSITISTSLIACK